MRLSGVFGGLRERLRSNESLPPVGDDTSLAGRCPSGHGGALLLGEKHSEKDLALDSEAEPASPSEQSEEEEDTECGVCLDAVVSELAAGWSGWLGWVELGEAGPCAAACAWMQW